MCVGRGGGGEQILYEAVRSAPGLRQDEVYFGPGSVRQGTQLWTPLQFLDRVLSPRVSLACPQLALVWTGFGQSVDQQTVNGQQSLWCGLCLACKFSVVNPPSPPPLPFLLPHTMLTGHAAPSSLTQRLT